MLRRFEHLQTHRPVWSQVWHLTRAGVDGSVESTPGVLGGYEVSRTRLTGENRTGESNETLASTVFNGGGHT